MRVAAVITDSQQAVSTVTGARSDPVADRLLSWYLAARKKSARSNLKVPPTLRVRRVNDREAGESDKSRNPPRVHKPTASPLILATSEFLIRDPLGVPVRPPGLRRADRETPADWCLMASLP